MNTAALFSAVIAFSLWGLFPIYWKHFNEIEPFHLFSHRLFWSLLTLWLYVLYKKGFSEIKNLFFSPYRWWLVLSAVLISSNWLLYVKAVADNKILEASMGYFLNPLINILIGRIFLKEELRKGQIPAIIMAVLGVFIMLYFSGLTGFPWMALSLSLTFALYGVIRKLVPVKSLDGLTFETTVVFIPLLLFWLATGDNFFLDLRKLTLSSSLLLASSGVITCLPLVLFAFSARNLPLQVLGFTQYLSPSFKFLCGWLIYHESISFDRWLGFIFIWIGLFIYSLEMIWWKNTHKS